MVRLVSFMKVSGKAFLAVALILSFSQALAATKVTLGTSALLAPQHLPVITVQEQGIGAKYGLTVEWVKIRGTATLMKALTAEKVDAGSDNAIGVIWAVARGVPAVIISSVGWGSMYIWVMAGSPIRLPAGLKGKKIAVTSLGGTVHAYGQAALKALGLEKDVKFVGTGGNPESLAAMRAGWVDAMVISLPVMVKLKLSGEARELVNVEDYLPKERADYVWFTHRRLARTDSARHLGGALVEALNFIRANPGWFIDKLKSEFGRTDQEAKFLLEKKDWVISPDGSLSRRQVENVAEFLIQYGLISKGTLPPLDQYFAPVFPR